MLIHWPQIAMKLGINSNGIVHSLYKLEIWVTKIDINGILNAINCTILHSILKWSLHYQMSHLMNRAGRSFGPGPESTNQLFQRSLSVRHEVLAVASYLTGTRLTNYILDIICLLISTLPQNTLSWVENECCCPRTVDARNINFTNRRTHTHIYIYIYMISLNINRI